MRASWIKLDFGNNNVECPDQRFEAGRSVGVAPLAIIQERRSPIGGFHPGGIHKYIADDD